MPLGTLDRTPPPFFRQGPSALTKLVFFSALALFLMVADGRFRFTVPLRAGIATALLPVQRALAVPVDMLRGGGNYLQGLQQALQAEGEARARMAALAEQASRARTLAIENDRLRRLLELAPALDVRSVAAEVMHEAPDPYSRRLVVDRGAAQGVRAGAPAVTEEGVIGQVTRVFPLSAEVTLLTDKDAAIPLLNRRTRQRAVAFGGSVGPAGEGMELRFLSVNADVQPGDEFETSGVDGVYPAGLAVARALSVERSAKAGFAQVQLAPLARSDDVRHVLLLEPLALQRPVTNPTEAMPAGSAASPGIAAASAATGPRR